MLLPTRIQFYVMTFSFWQQCLWEALCSRRGGTENKAYVWQLGCRKLWHSAGLAFSCRIDNVTKLALWGFHIHRTGSVPKLFRLDLVSPKQSGCGLVLTMDARMCVCVCVVVVVCWNTWQTRFRVSFSNDCKKLVTEHISHAQRLSDVHTSSQHSHTA